MKTELLNQAISLRDKIQDIKRHLEKIKTDRESPYDNEGSFLHAEPDFEENMKKLRNEFLPISISEFMEMYIARIEKEIKKLEKEFEKL
jgi:chaperonin cofactor prefoldin